MAMIKMVNSILKTGTEVKMEKGNFIIHCYLLNYVSFFASEVYGMVRTKLAVCYTIAKLSHRTLAPTQGRIRIHKTSYVRTVHQL